MKSAFKWILSVSFIWGLLSFGFVARVQAASEPSTQPTLSATEVSTPATPSTHQGHKARKSKPVGDSSAVPDPTSAGTESPTPETTPALHGHKTTNTKSTVDSGLAPQSSPVTTPIVKSEAVATAVPDYEFNAVIITGTKTKLKVLDSPAAVSVVPKSKIDQKNVVYFDDALTDLPGVQVSRVAEGGQAVTLTMRGIPGCERNLVLLDGFNLNQPVNQRVFWNRVPTQLVDHVEIVRGPFSALYGKSALGGVVNIITKEPEGQSFNLSENWDSTNTRVTSVNYQKKVNNYFSFYLGLENTIVNGYTDHQFVQASSTTTGTATQTVTGFVQTTNYQGGTVYNIGEISRTVLKNDNISGKVYFKPAPDQTISLLLNDSYWDQPTINQTGELGETWLTDVNTGAQVASGTVSLAGTGKIIKITQSQFLTAPGHNGFFGSYLQYKGKLNEALWLTANFAYTGGPHLLSESALPTTVTAFTGSNSGSQTHDQWEGLGNVQADFKLGQHHFILGAEHDESHTLSGLQYFPSWWDPDVHKAIPNTDTGLVDITEALFAQDEWKIFPSFSAFFGGRLDDWKVKDEIIYFQSTGLTISYPDRSVLNISPKLALVYKLGEKGSLRTSVGKAFNPPTPNQVSAGGGVTSATAITLPNPDLGPEKDTAWEVGGEYHFLTHTNLSATYFYNRLTDLIYTNSTISGIQTISQSINAGAARIQGIESELKQNVFRFLDAFVNYTFVDSEFIKNDAVPASVGKQIPYISRHMANIGVDFKWKNLDFAPSGTYHSKQFQTATNSDTVNGVQLAYDAYTTFDFKINYKFNSGVVSAGIDNIFDRRFYLVYLNPGRTYNVGARFDVF
jgi:iron complex outermembrane receptor protein